MIHAADIWISETQNFVQVSGRRMGQMRKPCARVVHVCMSCRLILVQKNTHQRPSMKAQHPRRLIFGPQLACLEVAVGRYQRLSIQRRLPPRHLNKIEAQYRRGHREGALNERKAQREGVKQRKWPPGAAGECVVADGADLCGLDAAGGRKSTAAMLVTEIGCSACKETLKILDATQRFHT